MEFYTYASRSTFMDGTNMLQSLHKNGWMRKRRVDEIEMIPTQGVTVNLKELNSQIAQVAVEESEVPIALLAETLNVYFKPFVNVFANVQASGIGNGIFKVQLKAGLIGTPLSS